MTLSCGCNEHYADLDKLTIPKARKQYVCEECKKVIEAGNIYYRYEYLYDGSWNCIKVCEACGDLGESMAELGFCWVLGDLAEAHKEYISEYTTPKLIAQPGAR